MSYNTKEKMKKHNQNHYLANREYLISQAKVKTAEQEKRYRQGVRLRTFQVLGGARCQNCGFAAWRALQIDHIDAGGVKNGWVKKHTRITWIIKNPEIARQKFQVLCANCNWIKRYTNNETTRGTASWCKGKRFPYKKRKKVNAL